jgi:hypothetical protein
MMDLADVHNEVVAVNDEDIMATNDEKAFCVPTTSLMQVSIHQ